MGSLAGLAAMSQFNPCDVYRNILQSQFSQYSRRILLTLTRLPNLILRGCSSVVSCTVSLRLAPIMAA